MPFGIISAVISAAASQLPIQNQMFSSTSPGPIGVYPMAGPAKPDTVDELLIIASLEVYWRGSSRQWQITNTRQVPAKGWRAGDVIVDEGADLEQWRLAIRTALQNSQGTAEES